MKPDIRQRLRYGEVPCRFRDPGLPIALEGRVECKHRRLRLFALDPAAGTGSNIEVRLGNMVVRGEGSGSADDGFPIRLFYKKSARRGGGTDESRETEIERGGAAAPDEDEIDTTMYPVEFFFDSAELRNDVLAVVQNRIANPVSTKNLSQQVIERLGLFGGHPSTKERAEEDADEVEFGGGSADNSPLKTKGNNKYQYGGSAASSTKSNRTVASWCLPGGAGERGTQARRNTYTNAGSGGASTRNKSAGAASGGRYYGSLLKNRISDFVSSRGSRTPGGAAVGRIEDGKENNRLPPKSLEQQKLETYLLHDCEAAPATTSGDTGTRAVQHHQLVDDLLHEYAAKPSLLRDYFEYQYGVGEMREEQFGWFLVQTQDESADAAREVFDKLKPPWTQISTFSAGGLVPGDHGAPVGGAGFAGGDYSHVSGGARASSYNEQTGKGGRAFSTGGAGAGGSFSMVSTGLVSSLNAYGFRRFLCDPVRNCIACRDPAENIGGQGGERGGSSVPLPPDLPLDSFLVAGCYLDGKKALLKNKSAPSSVEGREIVTWSREALAALMRLFRALTFLVVETETDEDVGVFSTSGTSKVAPSSRSGAEERGASSSSSPRVTCSDAVQIFEQLTEICETEDSNPFPLRVTFLTPQRKAAAALREAISRSSCLGHAATLLGEDINDERRLPTVMQIRARILLDVISNEQPPSSARRFLPPDPLPDSRTKRSDEAPPATVASAAAPRHANSGGSLAVVDMDKTPATSSTDLTKYWGRGISRVCTGLWLPDCTIFGARGYAAQQHAQPLRPWRVTIRPILVEKAFPLQDSDAVLRKVLRGVLDDELQAVHEQLFVARAMGEKQLYLLGNPLLDASASGSTNAIRSATAAVAKLSDKLSSSTWINRGALLANDNSMYASTTEQDEAAGVGTPLAANKLKESSLSLHVSVRSFALREHQSWFAPVTAQTTTNLFSRTAAVEALLLSKMKLQGGGGKGKKEDNYGRNNTSTKKQFVQADPTGAKGRSRQSSSLPDPEAFFIEAAEQAAETVRGGGAAREYNRENIKRSRTFVKSSGSDVFVSFVIPHPESGICTLELQTRNELTGRTAIVGSFCFPLRTLRPGLRWVPFVRNARFRGMLAFVSLSS